jgi:3-oxoacyl-[acyl-carrier-protein] synthase-3
MLHLNHVSYFVPSTTLKLEDATEKYGISRAQAKVFSRIYGLEYIPIAHNMSVFELLKQPVMDVLDNAIVARKQIRLFIHAHTAQVIAPFGCSLVQQLKRELGLQNALTFGVSMNNCASTLMAFEMANYLLTDLEPDAKALILTGERAFTHTVQVIPNTSITGDAAAVAIVGKSGRHDKMLALSLHTAGKFAKGIWLTPEESILFEKQYAPLLANTIKKAITKAGITIHDVKVILPHNVNIPSWSNVAKLLEFPLEKIYLNNIRKYAHCFGADILINYGTARRDNLLMKGGYYVMATVGLGATFAAAVFQH